MSRVLAVLLLTLLLSSQVHAGAHDLEISRFMHYCLHENESFTKEQVRNTARYIIYVGEYEGEPDRTYSVKETFMISINESNSSDISVMENTYEVEGTLFDKLSLENITYETLYPTTFETGEILALALDFNASREPEESKCKLWTGTDKYDCHDRDSCLKACFASPMGKAVATGVGWKFVDAVGEFANNTKAIDANLSELTSNIEELESKSGNLEILLDDIEQNLVGMQLASINISQSGLFDPWVYSFCWPINFNRTQLINAKIKVKRLKERMEPLLEVPNEAEAMAKAGAERFKLCKQAKADELARLKRLRSSFWENISSQERNFVKLAAFEFSGGPTLPVPLRSLEIGWE